MSQQQHEVPTISEYVVKRTVGGKAKCLAFHCPGCSAPLTAPLADAGQHESCPHCGTALRVPLHQEPVAAKPSKPNREPWHQREVFKRAASQEPKGQSVSKAPIPYQILLTGATLLCVVGGIVIVGSIFAAVVMITQGYQGIVFVVGFGGAFNGMMIMVMGQCIEAFRDLVLSVKRIEQRMSTRDQKE